MSDQPTDDLLTQMLDAFWCLENNSMTMTSKYRMVAVAELLAERIRGWAPDKGQAKICHLAINEVADRLIRESTNDLPTGMENARRAAREAAGLPVSG